MKELKKLQKFFKTDYGKLIGFTLIVLTILSLYFRFVGSIPFSVSQTTTEKKTTFDVDGEGKVTAIPDTAEINLGIQVNKPTVEAAQKEANEKINKIGDELKKLGIEEKYIKTINYSVYPEYDYRAGQKIVGYNVNITLKIKVKDFDKINQVIDTATSLGANQIGNLSFTIDDEKLEELKMEARKEAIEKAKKKAREIANAGGLRLGRIVNISESIPSSNYPTPLLREAGIGGTAEEQKTEIQPGESEITASVVLSYETL
ncbi:SIMPL domain-containing protein [Patescibacteria group bacterium]|nr:SIMPL domain-containing protein [Patescibacteria group bacterium]